MTYRKILTSGLLALVASSFAGTDQAKFVQTPMPLMPDALKSLPLGHTAPSTLLHLVIGMPYGDPVGMQRFVDSVSNPKSPNYRHFITPEEVGQRFGISAAAVQKVSDYMTANGMKVTLVGKNRLSMLVDATAAQAEKAFNTVIQDFVSSDGYAPRDGHLYSYTTTPMVPADIASSVIYISGLETFTHPKHQYPYIGPPDVGLNYNLNPLYSGGSEGLGRTIGISSWDGFQTSYVPDIYNGYLALGFGLWTLPTPASSTVTVTKLNGGQGNVSGADGVEGDLDIACVVGTAPLANVVVYDNAQFSLVGTLTQEANDNSVDVITMSYTWTSGSAGGDTAHNLFLSLNAQGITYFTSSGDTGTNHGNFPYPLYDPEVLLVGGTTLNVNDTSRVRTSEPAWVGSGGGWVATTDSWNVRPSYQVGTGVLSVGRAPYRLYPDVALNADGNTGYFVEFNKEQGAGPQLFVVGGTSGACPTTAAAIAVCEQKLIANGVLTADAHGHFRFGRINDLIYSFNGDASVFNDVTTGPSTGTLPDNTAAAVTTGWDVETGWGTMNFNGFVTKLTPTGKVASLSATPSTVEGGSGTAITGTVTLQAAASGNVTVNLSSADPSVVVPPTVTVASGATTGTFTITTNSVHALKTVVITASLNSTSATFSMHLQPPHLTGFTVNVATIPGGGVITGTVTVAEAAPAVGGASVTLSSSNSTVASVPTATTITGGNTSGTFAIHTTGVSASTNVTITAVANGVTMTQVIKVTPAAISGVSVAPTTTYGGQTVTATVVLTGQAPPGGGNVTVVLSNTTIATASTATLVIPAGQTMGTFTIAAHPVSASTVTVVKTTYLGVIKECNLVVKPALVGSVTSNVATVQGGVGTATITVTLLGPAGPGGSSVAMSVGPAATGTISPATLVVPAGATSATATYTAKAVNADTTATIKAAFFGASQSCTVKDTAALLSGFTATPTTVQGGSTTPVVGTLTLNGPNGPSTRAIVLTSSNPAVIAVNSTVGVAAGATTTTFSVLTKKVTTSTSVTITAKLGAVTMTQTITVNP